MNYTQLNSGKTVHFDDVCRNKTKYLQNKTKNNGKTRRKCMKKKESCHAIAKHEEKNYGNDAKDFIYRTENARNG